MNVEKGFVMKIAWLWTLVTCQNRVDKKVQLVSEVEPRTERWCSNNKLYQIETATASSMMSA